MPGIINHPRRGLAALALILIPAGALATMAIGAQPDGSLRCEIRARPEGGVVVLDAIAHADKGVSGTYSFQVKSAGGAGGTNIEQSGAFSAASGRSATLGTVTLGGNGAIYDAKLKLIVGDKSISCAERIGGAT